jgi:hypothetical protein
VQNGARGKEGRAGGSARQAPAKGVPRPGHSTTARSPVGERAHRRGGRRRRRYSIASPTPHSVGGSCCAAKRKWSEAKRERGPKRMRLGFPRGRATSAFYPTENGARLLDSD